MDEPEPLHPMAPIEDNTLRDAFYRARQRILKPKKRKPKRHRKAVYEDQTPDEYEDG